jgi:hypothetical protein
VIFAAPILWMGMALPTLSWESRMAQQPAPSLLVRKRNSGRRSTCQGEIGRTHTHKWLTSVPCMPVSRPVCARGELSGPGVGRNGPRGGKLGCAVGSEGKRRSGPNSGFWPQTSFLYFFVPNLTLNAFKLQNSKSPIKCTNKEPPT